MKMFRSAAIAGFLLASILPASAQWQVPRFNVPLGLGLGVSGLGSAAPGTAGIPLTSQGPGTFPLFSPALNAGIQPGAANTYKGSLNGSTTADIAMPSCTGANQALQYVSGTGPSCAGITATTGFDMPTNVGLSASVSGGALTIGLTTAAGATPSSGSPIVALFRSTNGFSNGSLLSASITAANSVTIPSGATLGAASSNVPFRIWIFLTYNSNAPQLGVAVCSLPTAIFPCSSWEYTLKTPTVINASATSAGVLYAPASLALDAVRIIGYCDYANGLTTAGTWNTSCTGLQVFGPGIKKPGDIVQTITATLTSAASVTTTNFANTGLAVTITPSAAANLMFITANGGLGTGTAVNSVTNAALFRGSAPTTRISPSQPINTLTSANQLGSFSLQAIDAPGVVTATTYNAGAAESGSNGTFGAATSPAASMTVQEIMG